jgi:hypothetical protein
LIGFNALRHLGQRFYVPIDHDLCPTLYAAARYQRNALREDAFGFQTLKLTIGIVDALSFQVAIQEEPH